MSILHNLDKLCIIIYWFVFTF